jgi:hypothetical protein
MKYFSAASPDLGSRLDHPARTYVGSDMSSNEMNSAITSVETAMPIMPVITSSSRA